MTAKTFNPSPVNGETTFSAGPTEGRPFGDSAPQHADPRFIEMSDAFPQILWMAGADGHVEWFNQRWYEFTGAADDMPVDAWILLIYPEDRAGFISRWKASIQSGVPFECECRLLHAADGEYRWHLARAVRGQDARRQALRWYGTATDIHLMCQQKSHATAAAAMIETDRAALDHKARAASRQLARQLDFTRGITDSIATGLYAVDLNGLATFVNPAAELLLGYAAADLLGKDMHQVIHYQHADHAAFPKEACPLLKVLQTGELVRVDDDVFTRADGTLLPVSYSSAPIVDENSVVGAVISFQDISQRKESEEALRHSRDELEKRVAERTSELREINTRLQASNRELQDFASVASHDLQEPLRKIQAFGDRLATRSASSLGPEGEDYLRRMKSAAGRMQTLINDLLSFSRVTTKAQPFVPVNLRDIANEVMIDLESALEKNGGHVELGNLPTIDADPLQIRQLLQNLIGNALKFRRPDVPSSIIIYARVVSVTHEDGLEREECQLLVEDNGIGFDEKYLDRIFNVFQRLHGRTEYEGTGIGLAVCRKIAERHGGTITARSVPGAGSTFIVTLPVHHQAPPVAVEMGS